MGKDARPNPDEKRQIGAAGGKQTAPTYGLTDSSKTSGGLSESVTAPSAKGRNRRKGGEKAVPASASAHSPASLSGPARTYLVFFDWDKYSPTPPTRGEPESAKTARIAAGEIISERFEDNEGEVTLKITGFPDPARFKTKNYSEDRHYDKKDVLEFLTNADFIFEENVEGRLPPDKQKNHFSLEIRTLIQNYGYAAVSQEVGKYASPQNIGSAPVPEHAETVLKNSTLGKLLQRYSHLLESIELPISGFKTLEQARAAARLSSTYDSLIKLQAKLGFEPFLKNERVTEARRLRADFYRKQQRALRPNPIRAGRPRKTSSPK